MGRGQGGAAELLRSLDQPHRRRRVFGGSRAAVQRLGLAGTLEAHDGCVNTVTWSENGDRLVSGSDDTTVCIWSYQRRMLEGRVHTGHTQNIFSTRFMPCSNDQVVVSCAGDGRIQVHMRDVTAWEQCSSSSIECHTDRVKKLGTLPADPNLVLSASEDSTLRQFDIRDSSCFSDQSELAHVLAVCPIAGLNSLSVNPLKPEHVAVAGGSDRVLVLDRRQPGQPVASFTGGAGGGHVTGVAFSRDGSRLAASYSGDAVCLFDVARGSGGAARELRGHLNMRTVKEVGWFGEQSQFVV